MGVHNAAQGAGPTWMMGTQTNVTHYALQVEIGRLVVNEVLLKWTEIGALLELGPMYSGMK